MKHYRDVEHPYFEIASGVRVVYPGEDQDETDYVSIHVGAKEVGSMWICEDAEQEAKIRAEEVHAIYDKGRADASRQDAGDVAEAVKAALGEGYAKGYDSGAKDALRTDAHFGD